LLERNLDIMLFKNMPTKFLFRYWHQHLLNILAFIPRILADLNYLPQIIKAKIDFIVTLNKTLKKRSKVLSLRVITDKELNKIISSCQEPEKIHKLTNYVSLFFLLIYISFNTNIFVIILMIIFYYYIEIARQSVIRYLKKKYYKFEKNKYDKLDEITNLIIGNGLLLVLMYFIFRLKLFICVVLSYLIFQEIIRIICRLSFSVSYKRLEF